MVSVTPASIVSALSLLLATLRPLITGGSDSGLPAVVMIGAWIADLFPGHDIVVDRFKKDFFGTLDLVKRFLAIRGKKGLGLVVLSLLGVFVSDIVSLVAGQSLYVAASGLSLSVLAYLVTLGSGLHPTVELPVYIALHGIFMALVLFA